MHPRINPLIRDVYRRWREALGVDQAELAKKIGTSGSRLSRWEKDQAGLSEKQLNKLGDALKAYSEEREKIYADKGAEMFHGYLFRELRQAHGLSQTALAERAGMLQFTISMFETGQTELKRYERERAVNALKAAMAEREEEIQQYMQIAHALEWQAQVHQVLANDLAESRRREQQQQETTPTAAKEESQLGVSKAKK